MQKLRKSIFPFEVNLMQIGKIHQFSNIQLIEKKNIERNLIYYFLQSIPRFDQFSN